MVNLLTFIFTTIPALFVTLFAYYGRKYTTVVAALMAFGGMLAVFISCINLILNTVVALIVVPGWLLTAIGMFMPANFSVVLAAIVSGKICREAYEWGLKKTDVVAKAN